MAQTFTGKMFSNRNNSLKAAQQNAGSHPGANLVDQKSGSVQHGGGGAYHMKNGGNFTNF